MFMDAYDAAYVQCSGTCYTMYGLGTILIHSKLDSQHEPRLALVLSNTK